MEHVLFSIITVCYNAGDALADTVNKTLAQTYPDFEVLVKDGMSTDGSVERLPENAHVRVVRRTDSGIYDAMNQAVAEARGEYLLFINCGDWLYEPDTLKKLAQAVERTHAPMYYGRCYYRPLDYIADYPRQITPKACYHTMICHQATVYARELLAARGYDTSYKIVADKEMLFYLVCKKGISPVYVDAVIANYEGGGASTQKEHAAQNAADVGRILRTYYTPSQRAIYRAAYTLTFPGLRRKIAHTKLLGGLYHRLTSRLFKHQSGKSA